jgi:hypothetical protein
VSVVNLEHTARQIRFEVHNVYTSAITFWQVRLQAACPDGTMVEAGGWSFDSLRTMAAESDADLFDPAPITPIAPGDRRQFSFVRPLDVASAAGDCDASEFKDLTVIFADGKGVGPAELIAAQLSERHTQSQTLKHWIGPIHEMLNTEDPIAALKHLRALLDEEYDDCEGRPLRDDEMVRCGHMNRALRWSVTEQINQMRRIGDSPESTHEKLERMVLFWTRFQELLAQQSLPDKKASQAPRE